MSSVPRFPLDDRVERQFGLIDVLPMFSADLRGAKRRVAGMAYATPALDRGTWDVLRIKTARMLGYVLGSTMREARAAEEGLTEAMVDMINTPAEADLPPRWALAAHLAALFRTAPDKIDDQVKQELTQHYSAQAIAQIVLNNLFGAYMAKVVVACGLDPAAGEVIQSTAFDTASFRKERGSFGMIEAARDDQ